MTSKYIRHPTLLDHQILDHKSLHDLDDIYALLNLGRIESILAPLYQSKDGPRLIILRLICFRFFYCNLGII
ncbi:MAG: hypothetical protein Q8K36_06135 [Alphaproteobacteria bacterium]|nr:hypothetical protein [Alphaproteobacteria bacterium]